MFAAFAVEVAEPPGLSSYGLAGTPPGSNRPYRSLVASRGSGSKWSCIALSAATGKWEEFFGAVTDGSPLDTLTRTKVYRSWNGSVLGTSAVNWQPADGTLTIYATPCSDILDGFASTNRGTTPPDHAVPGTLWEDSTGAPTAVLLKIMDATGDWITLGTINETANTFAPAIGDGTITAVKLAADAVETAKIKDLNVTTAKLADDAVTYAKIQNISTFHRLLGRNTLSAGDPEEVTAAQVLDWLAGTQGDILFRGASAWQGLGAGTAGQFLQTQGGGANPIWATVQQPFTKFQMDGSNVAGIQATGISAIGPRLMLIFFELDRVGGSAGSFTLRTLTSGGAVLASVSMSGTNDWCRGFAIVNSAYNGGRKVLQAWGIDGTGAAGTIAVANYNSGTTAQVDQVQALHSGANVSGNIAVFASS